MHAALRFGLRNPLYPVNTRLIFQYPVHILTGHLGYDFLVSPRWPFTDVSDFRPPALSFTILGIHAEKIARKQAGLIASRPCTDFKDRIFTVFRIRGHQQQFDLLFLFRDPHFTLLDLLTGHLPDSRIGLLCQHLLARFNIVEQIPVFFKHPHQGFQPPVLLVKLNKTLHIADHGRISDLLSHFLKAVFDRYKFFCQ